MKIRNGFVSNSSSSSFIVASSSDKINQEFDLTIRISLENYIQTIINNEKDLNSYFKENYGEAFLDGKYTKQIYEKCLKALEENKVVAFGSFSNDTFNPVETMLCEMGIPKNIENLDIIDNEPGF